MADQPKNRTLLGADCHMSGLLELDNDAIVLGEFEGDLRVSGHLDLGATSTVRGTIHAGSLKLAGLVEADVFVDELVELVGGATIRGTLFCPRVIATEQATIDARVCAGAHASEAATQYIEQSLCQAKPTGSEFGSHHQSDPQPDGDTAPQPAALTDAGQTPAQSPAQGRVAADHGTTDDAEPDHGTPVDKPAVDKPAVNEPAGRIAVASDPTETAETGSNAQRPHPRAHPEPAHLTPKVATLADSVRDALSKRRPPRVIRAGGARQSTAGRTNRSNDDPAASAASTGATQGSTGATQARDSKARTHEPAGASPSSSQSSAA